MIGVPPQHAGRRPKSVGALFGFFFAKTAHFTINYDCDKSFRRIYLRAHRRTVHYT